MRGYTRLRSPGSLADTSLFPHADRNLLTAGHPPLSDAACFPSPYTLATERNGEIIKPTPLREAKGNVQGWSVVLDARLHRIPSLRRDPADTIESEIDENVSGGGNFGMTLQRALSLREAGEMKRGFEVTDLQVAPPKGRASVSGAENFRESGLEAAVRRALAMRELEVRQSRQDRKEAKAQKGNGAPLNQIELQADVVPSGGATTVFGAHQRQGKSLKKDLEKQDAIHRLEECVQDEGCAQGEDDGSLATIEGGHVPYKRSKKRGGVIQAFRKLVGLEKKEIPSLVNSSHK